MREPERSRDTRATRRVEGGGGPTRPPSPAAFAGLGIQLVVSILLFVYAGRWLDGKLGTGPWLLVAGAFLGALAGFYGMYRSLMAATRDPREATRPEDRDQGNGGGAGSGR